MATNFLIGNGKNQSPNFEFKVWKQFLTGIIKWRLITSNGGSSGSIIGVRNNSSQVVNNITVKIVGDKNGNYAVTAESPTMKVQYNIVKGKIIKA